MLATHENPAAESAVIVTIERWHIWRGTIRYFIVGPGPAAMVACSAPDYHSPRPTITALEQDYANRAIALLEQRHGQSRDAGPEEIQQALADAIAGIVPTKRQHPNQQQTYAAPSPDREITISRDDADMIARVVSLVTGIPVRNIHSKSAPSSSVRSTVREAKYLFIGALAELFPGVYQKRIGEILSMSGCAISMAMNRHRYDVESFQDYKRKFAEIIRLASNELHSKAS